MLNLEEQFQALLQMPSPEGSHVLAQPIPGFRNHRLARDIHGLPMILISLPRGQSRTRPTPIKLEHLSVQHDVECRLTGVDGVMDEGQFTVIACLGTDSALHTYFLRVLESIILLLGPKPVRSDITRAIYNLVELFRAMTAAPRKSVQGLWAELFLIDQATDAAALCEAWHTTPEDKYDFSSDSQRIEVKSAANRIRQHQFSLGQLQPPHGTDVLIASLFIERAGAGTSLAELLDRIRMRIGSNLEQLMTLDRVVGMTLGISWRQAMDERFDYDLARHSLAFYDALAVPSIITPVPSEVSNVRFSSDLSGITAADLTHYRAAGGLFKAAI